MTEAQEAMLAETNTNVKTMIRMHAECHRERVRNTEAIHGNGNDGLKSEVKVLASSNHGLRKSAFWLWTFAAGTTVTVVLFGIGAAVQHFSTVH